jgi:protein SCO1/2
MMVRAFQALTGVLLGLGVVLWFFRPSGIDPKAGLDSYFLPDPFPVPSFELLTHRGEVVRSTEFGDRILVVFFGYTSCPDICPLTLSHLTEAFEQLGKTGEGTQVLFITVDPSRDTPERLERYLGAFHPSFLGLTGTEAEIRSVARGFGAEFVRNGEGDSYTVDHTARVFVLSPPGSMRLTFPLSATPDEMVRDLSLLLEEIS